MIAADSQPMLTYPEAAIELGCRAKTQVAQTTFIARLVAKGELKAFVVSSRFKRIRKMEVLRFIEAKETKLKGKR